MVGIALDDRRTQEARELEAQRAGEAALQNYFEQVGELLIEKSLREASPGDNLSTVVRAQTLSVLAGLDPDRKRILLLFLYESGLIYKDKPVVNIAAANLRKANLSNAYLVAAYLGEVHLSNADLSEANLSDAQLPATNLSRANLRKAKLRAAYLRNADLSEAALSEAALSEADLDLAKLTGADLSGADLSNASLIFVDLSGANMQGATGVTSQELAQQASSLEGAIMPDGSKHP
jgi:uncharacterized protein YjbI with pentapeptide repeats